MYSIKDSEIDMNGEAPLELLQCHNILLNILLLFDASLPPHPEKLWNAIGVIKQEWP